MSYWNLLINAVYKNNWGLVEKAVAKYHPLNDPIDMARTCGFVVGERLRTDTSCIIEVVNWLLTNPNICRKTFAEWIAHDAIKENTPVHKQVWGIVKPHISCEVEQRIKTHKSECDVKMI